MRNAIGFSVYHTKVRQRVIVGERFGSIEPNKASVEDTSTTFELIICFMYHVYVVSLCRLVNVFT